MPNNIDKSIAVIAAHADVSLTYGTNVFHGPPRKVSSVVPVKSVFVMSSGGQPPTEYQDGGYGQNLNHLSTQVFVRSALDDYNSGQYLADQVYETLRKADPAGTIGMSADQSAPFYIGTDEEGAHMWSMNFTTRARY